MLALKCHIKNVHYFSRLTTLNRGFVDRNTFWGSAALFEFCAMCQPVLAMLHEVRHCLGECLTLEPNRMGALYTEELAKGL